MVKQKTEYSEGKRKRYFSYQMVGLLLIAVISIICGFKIGFAPIHWKQLATCLLFQCDTELTQAIIWEIRVPRILVGFAVGMGLSLAGGILQSTTRNVLADPYLFGIIAGASLGASLAMIVLPENWSPALPVAAFFGALFAMTLVLVVSANLEIKRPEHFILIGVAVSFMMSSISYFLLFISHPFVANQIIFWLMGSLAQVQMDNFYVIILVVVIGLGIVLALNRQLDALLLGDETAHSLGIPVQKIRILMLLVCVILTATIVAYCGGIGFVGLMIPHIVRLAIGHTAVKLSLGSVLLGGCFLVWVDIIARSVVPGQEIPLGVITSALGSIFFLLMLKFKKR